MSKRDHIIKNINSAEIVNFFEMSLPSFFDAIGIYYKVSEFEETFNNIYREKKEIINTSNKCSIEKFLEKSCLSQETKQKFNISYKEGYYYLVNFERIKLKNVVNLIHILFIMIRLIVDFSKKFNINTTNKIGYFDEGKISLNKWSNLWGEFCTSDFVNDANEPLPLLAIFKKFYLGIIPADYSASYSSGLSRKINESVAITYPRIPLLTLHSIHKIDFFIMIYIIRSAVFCLDSPKKYYWSDDVKCVIEGHWGTSSPTYPTIENKESFESYFTMEISQYGWRIKFTKLPAESKDFVVRISTAANEHSTGCFTINVYYKHLTSEIVSCYAQAQGQEQHFAIQKQQFRMFNKTKQPPQVNRAVYALENICSWTKSTCLLNVDLWLNMDEETENNIHNLIIDLLSSKRESAISVEKMDDYFLHVSNNNIQFDHEKYSTSSENNFLSSWYRKIQNLHKKYQESDCVSCVIDDDSKISMQYFDKAWNVMIGNYQGHKPVKVYYCIQKNKYQQEISNQELIEILKIEYKELYNSIAFNKRNSDKENQQSTIETKISKLVQESREFARQNNLPHKTEKRGRSRKQ